MKIPVWILSSLLGAILLGVGWVLITVIAVASDVNYLKQEQASLRTDFRNWQELVDRELIAKGWSPYEHPREGSK